MPARDDSDRISQASTRLVARSDRAAASDPVIWRAFLALTATTTWGKDKNRAAALSNIVAVALLGDAEDVLTLDSLVRTLGAERVAALQAEIDDLLGLGHDLPVSTAFVRLLADAEDVRARLKEIDLSSAKVTAITARVHHQAFWLLLTGAEDLPRAAPLSTPEQVRHLIADGSARDWRIALLPLIESPWGPYGEQIIALATEADAPHIADALTECRSVYQERQEQREREAIAREIRRLVAISGLTQRDFAAQVGTSPSRLSTYVNGRVIPSAAMLLRIRRVSRVNGAKPR